MDSKPASIQNLLESDGFGELATSVKVSSKRWAMNFFPNLRDASIRWSEDDAGALAASVAYY